MERTRRLKHLWKDKLILKIREDREPREIEDEGFDENSFRQEIEPWLTALFQSEYLSLLTGAGLSSAAHILSVGEPGAGMSSINFSDFKEQIDLKAKESAKNSGRGTANIEDQIRIANELIRGLEIFTCIESKTGQKEIGDETYADVFVVETEFQIIDEKRDKLVLELKEGINKFAKNILESEKNIVCGSENKAVETLMSFLMSFASRSATRERLNIFTTNYDRVIEFGAELAGIHLIDRFQGTISPIFRSSRLKLDIHYNPPGIRGEPRYLEGVSYITKLHGSIDWIYKDGYVRRIALPYGADDISKYSKEEDVLMIYPNSSKDRETSEYPYVELFRDFASSVCRPNSTLVVYGYSFGDEHINRVIADMLSIPSTHLVIISYDDNSGRVHRFYEKVKRPAQITLLIGKKFGDLETLVKNYLPKSAIDRTSIRMAELLKARGWNTQDEHKGETKKEEDKQ
ncbi:SIR2 family protein [Marivirga sp.]|uniref:SIR2 family protein n=1 Tax=Marivirga sp. TaxID=2018662 RepID=UPI0025DB4E1D|nr:SIR2 family protein [Marivirga sp.]